MIKVLEARISNSLIKQADKAGLVFIPVKKPGDILDVINSRSRRNTDFHPHGYSFIPGLLRFPRTNEPVTEGFARNLHSPRRERW